MDTFQTEKSNPIRARQKKKQNKRGLMLFGFFAVICLVIVILLVKIILNFKIIESKTEQNLKEQKELDQLLIECDRRKNHSLSVEREMVTIQNTFKEINDKINQIKGDIEKLTKNNNDIALND